MKINKYLLIAGFPIVTSCSTSHHPSVEEAEASLNKLKTNADVQMYASLELEEAEELLDRAKSADSEVEEKHVAYLTQRKIQTAFATASQKNSEVQIENLNQMRDKAMIASHQRAALSAEQKVGSLKFENSLLKSQLREFKSRETNRGFEVTLSDVIFETDRAELKPGAEQRLLPLAKYLSSNSGKIALVEGHTDNVGDYSYNLRLSEKRAESVKNTLVRAGVNPNQITVQGFGKSKPLTTNDTPEGRLQNRRVDVIIMDNSR